MTVRILIVLMVVLSVSGFLYATGPGGVSDGLVLWLDAEDLNLNDEDAVETWTDKSGQGNHATQGTLANRPTFKTDILNGKPVIRFDGNNNYLMTVASNLLMPDNLNITIFSVSKLSETNNITFVASRIFTLRESFNNSNRAIGVSRNSKIGGFTRDGGTATDWEGADISLGTSYIYGLLIDDNFHQLYLNGLASGDKVNYTPSNPVSEDTALIGRDHDTGSRFWEGDIAEIIIYDRALSDTERLFVENYLSYKYDIDLHEDADLGIAPLAGFGHDLAFLGKVGDDDYITKAKSAGLTLELYEDIPEESFTLYFSHNAEGGVSHLIRSSDRSRKEESDRIDNPAGGYREVIEVKLNQEWHVSEISEPVGQSPNVRVLFNFNDLGLGHLVPLDDPSGYRLLFKAEGAEDFVIADDEAVIVGDDDTVRFQLRLVNIENGVITLGTVDNVASTLPVELSSFTAIVTAEMFVQLEWTAETETNMLGYNVYRSENDKLSDAVKANFIIIPAHNQSTARDYNYIDQEVDYGTYYYYWLQSNDLDLTHEFHGPVSVFVEDIGTPGGGIEIPFVTELKGSYPNPFNPGTYISFSLEERSDVTITIYNAKGQLIKTLIDNEEFSRSRNHRVYWDGRDYLDNRLSSGIYFYIMKVGDDFQEANKMIMMK